MWRGSAAEAAITNLVADVPVIEKPETENLPPPWAGSPARGGEKQENTAAQKQKNTENTENTVARSEIPSRMNLAVPFTSQAPEKNWEQPWQDACEEAAVLMLDAYYKGYNLSPLFAKDEILKMVAWENARGWQYSIEIQKVKQLMGEYFGYDSKLGNKEIKKLGEFQIIENPTVEQLKQSIAAGHPVLVVADGKALPNPHFRNGGPVYHALIIRGYTEDSFITNDPGTWRGENFVYKYEDLMNAIRDWNSGDVKQGRRVVLALI